LGYWQAIIERRSLFVLLIMLMAFALASCGTPSGTRSLARSTGGYIPRDSYGEPMWRHIAPQPAPPEAPPAGLQVRQYIPLDINKAG